MASSTSPRLLLVGASSPLGAQVKARLEDSPRAFREVVLAEVGDTDASGARQLGEFGGEAVLVQDVGEVDFASFDVALLLGSAVQMTPLLEAASRAGACVDASGASRRRSGVSWRLDGMDTEPAASAVAAPHPVAATLVRLLQPLSGAGLLHEAAATVLLPAASLGPRAVEELQQQAVGVLNFQDLPDDHLHGRLAFNVLPWDDAEHGGASAEDLAWEVGCLLGRSSSQCSIQLLRVSTFHGYAFSIRVTLESDVSPSELLQHLKGEHVQIATGNVSLVEAMNGTSVVVTASPAGAPRSYWLWAVADSLGAVAAANIVDLVEQCAAQVSLTGKVS